MWLHTNARVLALPQQRRATPAIGYGYAKTVTNLSCPQRLWTQCNLNVDNVKNIFTTQFSHCDPRSTNHTRSYKQRSVDRKSKSSANVLNNDYEWPPCRRAGLVGWPDERPGEWRNEEGLRAAVMTMVVSASHHHILSILNKLYCVTMGVMYTWDILWDCLRNKR